MTCRCWNPARPSPTRGGHLEHEYPSCPIGKAHYQRMKRLFDDAMAKFRPLTPRED